MEESWHDVQRTQQRIQKDRPGGTLTGKFPYPVVGICDAGDDFGSLVAFFGNAPATMNMAFVVLCARSDGNDVLLSRLRDATVMPVTGLAAETAALSLQRNHIYLLPSMATVSIDATKIDVRANERPPESQPPFDVFLRSLADAHGGRAMAVMLLGVEEAGLAGMEYIREGGGITIVEARPADPAVATHGTVGPHDAADFTLPAAGIPAKLAELWGSGHVPGSIASDAGGSRAAKHRSALEEGHALYEILAAVLTHTGHDFGHYKRAAVLRRVERRMRINSLPDLSAYRDFVLTSPAETHVLRQDLLIGVTHFFRNREAFAALQDDVVPLLFDSTPADAPLRVWVPGCSTGEEAYSIAMLLREHAEKCRQPRDMQLFATDVDARAIARGRLGQYPQSIVADLRPEYLHQHFRAEPLHYQVSKSLRKMVLFAQHDILRDPPFARLDLVSCRNLLIYMDRAMQRRVLQLFHFALRPGGHLFLGSAENVDLATDLFDVVDKQHCIFRSKQTRPRRSPHGFSISVPRGDAAPGTAPPLAPPVPAGELHEQTMLRCGPPSILVNRQYDVLHISERAARYLRHVGGEPSQWLPDILRPELKAELRGALHEALLSSRDVAAAPVVLIHEGQAIKVAMSVYPVSANPDARIDDVASPSATTPHASSDPFALVVFHETRVEQDAANAPVDGAPAVIDAARQAVDGLEHELRDARRQIKAALAYADSSTEALRASNEELQAMNEELHSTTEELETSKEELQSINEELLTVNAELQAKIQEGGKVNDDLLNLISSNNVATLFFDRTLVLSRYTPAAATLFNVIPSDIGRSLLDITHHLDYPDLASDMARAFDSLQVIEKEVTGPEKHRYLSRLSPYRTAADRIEGAVLTLIDITSLRDAQEKMRTSEKRLQLVAQCTDDYAIIVHDTDGRIVTWNKGAERMFGYTEAETLGQSGQLIYSEEDRRAGVGDAEAQRALTQGRSQDEGWLIRKDGTRLYCSGVTIALHSDDFAGYAKIARDLTDGETAESAGQLQHSLERSVRKQVDTANRLKDEFLAVLSHELKNPLNLIHVKAEMLSRAPDVRNLAVVQEASDAIRRSVAAQAKIIDDLLDLSRVRTGKLTLSEELVDVARIVATATDALESDAAAAGLTLTASGTQDEAIVRGDGTRIEQIVWNLLSNALKFTPAGGRVDIALTHENDQFCISVTDTGEGIDAAFLPHIFTMFSQAESAFNRERGGLGIGLALVQQLTQMHGGHVSAESRGNGQGACFRVWLPRTPTDTPVAPSRPPTDTTALRDKKILLVDDTLETLEAFRILLELEGAQVRMESNGRDALRATTEEHFDIVLSDIGMPGMDGYELVRALRQTRATASLPAVAMTGFGRAQDIDRALKAGFNVHLGKPVSLDALLDAIYAALAWKRARPAETPRPNPAKRMTGR